MIFDMVMLCLLSYGLTPRVGRFNIKSHIYFFLLLSLHKKVGRTLFAQFGKNPAKYGTRPWNMISCVDLLS